MSRLALLSLCTLLAGCAHMAPGTVADWLPPALLPGPALRSLAPPSQEPGPAGTIAYRWDGTRRLVQETWRELSREQALETIERRRALLLQSMQKQFDPYVGLQGGGNYCEREPVSEARPREVEGEISLRLELRATRDFHYDCANPTQTLRAQLLFLYCPRERVLYRLDYLYPEAEAGELGPVARCR